MGMPTRFYYVLRATIHLTILVWTLTPKGLIVLTRGRGNRL